MMHQLPGIYLHVPFCLGKCLYCDFFSVPGAQQTIMRYHQAIIASVEELKNVSPWKEMSFSTIFFGGGTPSVLPVSMLTEMLNLIRNSFHFEGNQPEYSIEVNPATIDFSGLHRLRQEGFNRLSIGMQSLNNHELKLLGRRHSRDDALQVFKNARKAGFDNINLDLMYGLPGQTVEKWLDSLDAALNLNPEHMSIYELTLEPNTPFTRAAEKGEIIMPDEDTVLKIAESLYQRIDRSPFTRYEISNYARPGFECRHNLNYWHNGSYLGIGPASVSAHKGKRWTMTADLDRFTSLDQHGLFVTDSDEQLDPEAYFRETVIIGLRMLEGVDINHLSRRFGFDPVAYYGSTLEILIKNDLLEIHNQHLRLTEKGLPLANTVMAELV